MVLDGLGDQALESLGGRTPLQVARTPQLDHLALLGGGGSYHPGKRGMAYFSDLSLFLALGYSQEEFPGRGVLGAYSVGLSLEPQDVCLLASLAYVDEGGEVPVLVERGGDLTREEWDQALELLDFPWEHHGVKVSFHPLEVGIGLLHLVGEVDPRITDSDPSHRGGRVSRVMARGEGGGLAAHTAMIVNLYLEEVARRLKGASFNEERVRSSLNPMNALLVQGAGQDRFLEPLDERWGFDGALVASDPFVLGMGRKLGMKVMAVEDGDPQKELLVKFREALPLLESHSLIVVHTRAPKLASRRHNPWEKVKVLEELDGAFFFILEHLVPREERLLVVWGGSSTSTGGPYLYSGEPSPLLMIGPRVRRGPSLKFDEPSLAYGSIGFLRGEELMLSILSYAGRAPLGGRHMGPEV